MKKFCYAMAAAAALTVGSAANAAINVTFDDGNGGLSAGEVSYATFDPGSTGGVTGSGYIIQSGSNSSGADPAVGGQGDPYLSVLGGGNANFTFEGGLSSLGLDYGSADAYNTFVLFLSDGTTANYTGSDLINIGTADGNQTEPRTNGRLTFTTSDGVFITGLRLLSGQNSLEVDNLGVVSAVPEPGTWAMMLLGFGAIGFSMRRRRQVHLMQAA
ncbi:PEPxxWA-CTERM sorting domain-containing protein [Sphingomonas arenae]|uniref:PEPxxWA-CTERM sorting domain-containing protein n=1 Tax=Sphingomonas arenae TaxID=2812555 RepID=UPI001F26D0DF|nr:PEPxxWA-CTERM sorting domain-containing protein [Sphingomonas arenae]